MSLTPEQLQQQILQLQEFVTHLQKQIQTPTIASTTTSSKKGLKVATPDVFDGTLSKAETFLNQLSLYFLVRKSDFQDDQDKINFTLSYMRGGTAGPWADQIIKKYEDPDQESAFGSWAEFKKEFESTFLDPNPAGTARYKMDHLRQGGKTADEYVASFRELISRTGYNDAAHVEKFEKGLNSALVDKIYALPEMPSTLKEWVEWAMKLDRQWRQREANKKTVVGTSLPRQSKPILSTFTTSPPIKKGSDIVPMEIDSGRRRGPLICFKCRKPGHIAMNCQSKVDVRSMDYESIKTIMKEELQKEGFSESHQ